MRDVMVDGRFVMRDRTLTTIDLAGVQQNIQAAAQEAMVMSGISGGSVWPVT